MSYTYYQEIVSDEHCLFGKEIAQLYNVTPQRVAQSVNRYLQEHALHEPKLFYKTKHGLARVYPEAIWKPAMAGYALTSSSSGTK